MISIDLRTMGIVLFVVHLLQVFLFTHLYVTNRSMREVKWWLFWSLSGLLSFFLISVRDILGEPLIIVILQNFAMVSGAVFIYIGVLRFFSLKRNMKMILLSLIIYAAALITFTIFWKNVRIHTSITNIYLSVYAVITAVILIKNRASEKSNALLLIFYAFLFHGLVFGLRALLVAIGVMDRQDFFSSDPVNILTFIDGIITSILWTFGFILLINQRVNQKFKESLKHFETIFNTSPDITTLTNMQTGRLVNVNQYFTSIVGY
ncbi:MAG: hypothetical protein R6V47_08005, partial [Candidatus Delongbacteria bacterium]